MRKLIVMAVAALLVAAPALAQEGPKLTIGGTTYTKWLYGSQHTEGGLQGFDDNGRNYGDSGQGSEVELLLDAKLSRQVEVKSRLHSRFNENYWTNFGGFGGQESNPQANQYVKLRGVQVILTPGYTWIDSATIGNNDFGQFDPMVIGKLRYIDRDNAAGLLFQGSGLGKQVTWDMVRISLPRLWAGPGYNTGDFKASDALYGGQIKFVPNPDFDVGAIGQYTFDDEIDPADFDQDNGRALKPRFQNAVGGLKFGWRGGPWADVKGAAYLSHSETYGRFGVSEFFGGVTGNFSPVVLGQHTDWAGKLDWVMNDPFGVGLTINLQGFYFGANYLSIFAARRESDVLLTEGHDGAFPLPGPANSRFAGYGATPAIGWGGWDGNAQQVATVNVDNSFSDFDEPLAETVIGWKGFTINPVYTSGPLELAAEFTLLGYDTNWQAWGSDRPVTQNQYPVMETAIGVGSYRSAYQPFQDKATQIAVLRGKYTIEAGRGIDVFGKVKYIHETDDRMTDARYLPFQAGDCPGGGVACENVASSTNQDTDSVFANPAVVGTGYEFKPFDSVKDDDRKMDYWNFTAGAGYQLFDELYVSATYAKFLVDLKDGNTAFQGWNSQQEFTSGKYDKNQAILKAKYILAGIEFGLEGQYNWGTFKPEPGDGFVLQFATQAQADRYKIPVGTPGFTSTRLPRGPTDPAAFVRLDDRSFSEVRLKAFMKAQF